MARLRQAVVCLCLASMLATGDALVCAVSPNPKILLRPTSLQLGEIPFGEQTVREISLENAGTSPLRIAWVKSTCGCLGASCDRSEIPPGEKGKITVTVRPPRGYFGFSVYISSNDPSSPLTEVRGFGMGTFPGRIIAFPNPLHVTPDQRSYRIGLNYSSTKESLFQLSTDFVSDLSGLLVKATTSHSTRSIANVYRATGTIDLKMPRHYDCHKTYSLRLRQAVKGGDGPEVNIQIIPERPYALSEPAVFFGYVNPDETVSREILISSGSPWSAKACQNSRPEIHSSLTRLTKSSFRLRVTCANDTPQSGAIHDEVVIKTSLPNCEEVRIPVACYLR